MKHLVFAIGACMRTPVVYTCLYVYTHARMSAARHACTPASAAVLQQPFLQAFLHGPYPHARLQACASAYMRCHTLECMHACAPAHIFDACTLACLPCLMKRGQADSGMLAVHACMPIWACMWLHADNIACTQTCLNACVLACILVRRIRAFVPLRACRQPLQTTGVSARRTPIPGR